MSRVALIGENSIEYVNILLDIWNSDDCAVLIDWRIPLEIAVSMMIEADVHKCYIEKNLFRKNREELSYDICFLSFKIESNTAEYLPEIIYNKFKQNYSRKEALVLYSSGTTGKSKRIILSHFAINKNADAIIDYIKPDETDCIYIAKTMSHSSTLTGELLVAIKTHTKLVSDNYLYVLKEILNKDIIVIDLSNNIHKNKDFFIPELNYDENPVVAILSLGEFNDQYSTEILINKILTENGAKINQYFSPFTKRVIESCSRAGHINTSLLESHNKDYDIIVLAINEVASYSSLLRIMCDISPDVVILCVNKSYKQEEELKHYLCGCGNINAIIRSPYISYEIIKGKTFPVYCGYENHNYYGSFEKNQYNILKKCIFSRIYLPENIAIL